MKLQVCGFIDLENKESSYLFWTVIERHVDPRDSVIRYLIKTEDTKHLSKFLAYKAAQSSIRKAQWGLSLKEFKDILILFCYKYYKINSKVENYERKLYSRLIKMIESLLYHLKSEIYKRISSRKRVFPKSVKDTV